MFSFSDQFFGGHYNLGIDKSIKMAQKERNFRISEEKMAYLNMIQEPIGRMSTASSVFKGFTATIVAGIAALSYNDIKVAVLVLSFIPVLSFLSLDIYYLRLERKYRCLYEDVLSGRHEVDFSISFPNQKNFLKRAHASIWSCMSSPSIWLFYPAMLIILVVVCILKCNGRI